MDSESRSILILDANQRSGLAVTRSLGQAFPDRRIFTADSTTSSLAGQSKYCHKYLIYPDPKENPDEFITWIKGNASNRFGLVLPTTEITSQLLLTKKDQLADLPLAFPNIETVLKLADKGNLMRTAEQLGINTPKTQYYRNINDLDQSQLTYPLVLKPCLSKILTANGWISTTVRIINDPKMFKHFIEVDNYLSNHPFMIQEFIPGHGAGLFCLYNNGHEVQFFAHRRIREKPPEGGVSVLSQAAHVDPKLKEYASRLLSNVGWHGVAMVEFRISKDGVAYLMEVNTRFWGSLQLAIDSGVDFPAQLVKLHFGEEVTPVKEYNTNQRLRWLLGDLDSLYIFLKRNNSWPSKCQRVVQFITPRLRNQKHEVNRLSDIKPFFEELKQYFNIGGK